MALDSHKPDVHTKFADQTTKDRYDTWLAAGGADPQYLEQLRRAALDQEYGGNFGELKSLPVSPPTKKT